MRSKDSASPSGYAYLVCALVGAFVAFTLPATVPALKTHTGTLAVIIELELRYENLILALGATWLLYLLLKRKVRGAQGIVMCGGLGFACMRLMIALVAVFRR
jgi:hypothetical protein